MSDETSGDERLVYPATERNRSFILDVLRAILPEAGLVLEVASGSGEHVVHLAAALPSLVFQPSDPSDEARRSIAAWTRTSALSNIRPPLALNAAADDWGLGDEPSLDAILNVNMIHISPFAACEGLMAGAGRHLPADAPLYLYGPFRRDGRHTAPSNEAFDRSLRERDPRWGVRDVAEVAACGERHGLALAEIVEMPANNLSLIFRRQ